MSPQRAAKPCSQPGCPVLVYGGDNRCPPHRKQFDSRRDKERRDTDETWALYQTPRWRRYRKWFIGRNPVCQRIVDGKQCTNFADTVHHRLPIRENPERLCDATVTVAVCRQHHHHGAGDIDNEQYAPTVTD